MSCYLSIFYCCFFLLFLFAFAWLYSFVGVRFVETLDLSNTKIQKFTPLLVGIFSSSFIFFFFVFCASQVLGQVEMPSLKRLILRNCSQLTVIRVSNAEFHHLDITGSAQLEEIVVKSRALDFLPLDDKFTKLRRLDAFLPPSAFVAAMRLSLVLQLSLSTSSSSPLPSTGSSGIGIVGGSGSEFTVSGPNAKLFRTAMASLQEFCSTHNQWHGSERKKALPIHSLTILRV
jgi:hypothetical protein